MIFFKTLILLTLVISLANCATTSKEQVSSSPPAKSDPLGIPVAGIYHGGQRVTPEQANHITEGKTTKQEVIALLMKPSLETPSCDGGTLLCYYHLSEMTHINPINVLFFGALGGWLLSYQNVERQRDVVWILIGPDNKVSKAVRYSEAGMYSLITYKDDDDLFDGRQNMSFPIRFVSDPPGARIDYAYGSLSVYKPYPSGPAVMGKAPYAPISVYFAKLPGALSILKQWRFRAVWEDTGHKSRTVFLHELFACPRDFVFRPEK
jgi:hypothetical protein